MASPNEWLRSNFNKTNYALSRILRNSGKAISQAAKNVLITASEDFISNIEVPFYTGNLQDSIGVQILHNRRLVSLRFLEQEATQPQRFPQTGTAGFRKKGTTSSVKVWGRQRLMLLAYNKTRAEAKGIVAQLLVAVPYAHYANENSKTHPGYIERLTTDFENTMFRAAKTLEKRQWKVK